MGRSNWVVPALVFLALAAAFVGSPVVRARVARETQFLVGWTEAARCADPEGFTTFVEGRLQRDLQQLLATRSGLAVETGHLVQQAHKQADLLEHAEQLAAEFREVVQQVCDARPFPVTVRGGSYSREEVESQVSLLLAEADGYRREIGKLHEVRQQAEQRLEEIAVRINATQSQLAAIAAQRELLRARRLSDEAERLVAQVDELLQANDAVLHANPVRTTRELLASPSGAPLRPRLDLARQFLAASPTAANTDPIPGGSESAPRQPESGPSASVSRKPRVDKPETVSPLAAELGAIEVPPANLDDAAIFQQK